MRTLIVSIKDGFPIGSRIMLKGLNMKNPTTYIVTGYRHKKLVVRFYEQEYVCDPKDYTIVE